MCVTNSMAWLLSSLALNKTILSSSAVIIEKPSHHAAHRHVIQAPLQSYRKQDPTSQNTEGYATPGNARFLTKLVIYIEIYRSTYAGAIQREFRGSDTNHTLTIVCGKRRRGNFHANRRAFAESMLLPPTSHPLTSLCRWCK